MMQVRSLTGKTIMQTLKTFTLTLFFALTLMVAPEAWSQDRFVADLGELPLMPVASRR
jgi:hypothetical protein